MENRVLCLFKKWRCKLRGFQAVPGAIIVRKWKIGDFFYPNGMKAKKKISKYFKDEKFDINQKENQWLLCSGDNILWVIGKRADRRFLAKKQSPNIINIECQ